MNTSLLVRGAGSCRSFTRIIAACLVALLIQLTSAAQSPPETPSTSSKTGFRFESVSDKSLGLWEGDRPVFVYNHGVIGKEGIAESRHRASYFHPVYGLDGEVLTDDFPRDHVAHRGIYWAWPHVKVGEQEFDLWGLRGIRVEFQRWLAREADADGATLGIENVWVAGGKTVMQEKVSMRVHPASEQGRAMDVELTWTPTDQPVTLWGAEGKSYGGFTFRFAPRTQTVITVPDGRTTNDLVVTKLPWADFSADFKGARGLSGAAVFVHPSHPDFPPTWMTREYGVLAVGWPGVAPQTFPAGKAFTCRYRVWIHRGAPEATEIQKVYESYRAGLPR